MSSAMAVAAARPVKSGICGWRVDFDRLAAFRPAPALSKRLGTLASVAITAFVIYVLRGVDWSMMWPALSAGALFWLVFVANYVHVPLAEGLIFGRLWGPRDGLFTALVRKQIVNTLVLPYAGEALLLDWARGRGIRAFGGVKDAAILSALAGSLATVVLVLPVWAPLSAALGVAPSTLLASICLLSSVPVIALVKRNTIFTLPGVELRRIGLIHTARVFANVVLMAACWHLLLPSAPLQSWLMLAAARMVVLRLPLLPNKEIALAAVAVAMFPGTPEVAGVIAATSVLLTLSHAIIWVGLAGVDLTHRRRAATA